MELCEILGISIHEFLAGEDISEENIIKRSEDNLLQVTKDSKDKQKNLKSIILALLVIMLVAVASLGIILFRQMSRPKNYITSVPRESAEMKTAELLSGRGGAFLFRYFTEDEFKTLTIYMSEYHKGELIAKEIVAGLTYEDIDPATEGMIVLMPDYDEFEVHLIITDDYAKYSTAVPILEGVENREYYGRGAAQIEGDTLIRYDAEQGLAGLIYGENGLYAMDILQMENGDFGADNDYVYYFSIQFGKDKT